MITKLLKIKAFPFFLLSFLFACQSGDEVVRIPVMTVSTEEDPVYHSADEVQINSGDEIHFWVELDYVFEKDPEIWYKVNIYLNDEFYKEMLMDPHETDMSINRDEGWEGDLQFYSIEAGRNVVLTAENQGLYRFEVALMGNPGPKFDLRKFTFSIFK